MAQAEPTNIESTSSTYETYEHYSDESIIVAARMTDSGDEVHYECRRYFTHGPVDTFVLDAEAFEGIYVPLKPEATE